MLHLMCFQNTFLTEYRNIFLIESRSSFILGSRNIINVEISDYKC